MAAARTALDESALAAAWAAGRAMPLDQSVVRRHQQRGLAQEPGQPSPP